MRRMKAIKEQKKLQEKEAPAKNDLQEHEEAPAKNDLQEREEAPASTVAG